MSVPSRIRGLLGIAFVWGVAISAVGTAFFVGGLATGLIARAPGFGPGQWASIAVNIAVKDFIGGALAGAVFATLLAGAEGRRTLDTLSLWRVGGWGFLASAIPTAVAGALSAYGMSAVTFAAGTIASGLVGACLGVGMVRLARRGITPAPAESAPSIA
ncbi:MAG TPA: hypothetical protein VH277_19840 [Gemmatimonadaceae bacterium]|jgi:hypothetical protein|nr:hypothetical protein [Gemmatimonadaceae bacterium]